MKTVSYEEFLGFRPCWLGTMEGAKKLERIGRRKDHWTALDVLDLPEEEVSAEEKLWAVLREEFIEPEILHEFACRCAERALALVEKPDPRSVAAIEAKRRWLRGEIGDDELREAWDAARDAAGDAARDAAGDAAWAAVVAADRDGETAAWSATWDAARAAVRATARDGVQAADLHGVWADARKDQTSILRELLANEAGKKRG